jgi:DNA primase
MKISEIKQKLSILSVLSHYGLEPNSQNHIKCPFHKDDKPSMRIYPETNTYHCFGCGKTGDVIQFIQDKEEITKHRAITKAKELLGESKEKPVKTNAENM